MTMNDEYKKWFEDMEIKDKDAVVAYALARLVASLNDNAIKSRKMPSMPREISGNAGLWFGYIIGFTEAIKLRGTENETK